MCRDDQSMLAWALPLGMAWAAVAAVAIATTSRPVRSTGESGKKRMTATETVANLGGQAARR
jgi:hypothetical protein